MQTTKRSWAEIWWMSVFCLLLSLMRTSNLLFQSVSIDEQLWDDDDDVVSCWASENKHAARSCCCRRGLHVTSNSWRVLELVTFLLTSHLYLLLPTLHDAMSFWKQNGTHFCFFCCFICQKGQSFCCPNIRWTYVRMYICTNYICTYSAALVESIGLIECALFARCEVWIIATCRFWWKVVLKKFLKVETS